MKSFFLFGAYVGSSSHLVCESIRDRIWEDFRKVRFAGERNSVSRVEARTKFDSNMCGSGYVI